jgi:guanylate kinase
MPKLILISGPSCIGKSPLVKGIGTVCPKVASLFEPLVLSTDRARRPGEEDGKAYHFRTRAELEKLRKAKGHVVVDNRGDLHALELAAIDRIHATGRHALYEGNPRLPAALREAGVLDRYDTLSIFLSPLSREELRAVQEAGLDPEALVTDIQRRKLLHRTTRQEGMLSRPDLDDIEIRATSAYDEMHEAWRYDAVVPLHDGEGHDNWSRFGLPIGSARAAIRTVAALISGRHTGGTEYWEADLLQ